MSVDILGTSWDECVSMVQYCFTSTETIRFVRTESPGRPPRLSHSSWTLTPTSNHNVLQAVTVGRPSYCLECIMRMAVHLYDNSDPEAMSYGTQTEQSLPPALGGWEYIYLDIRLITQGSRRDQKIKRREVELALQVSPEEIMSREVELGCESWTSFASSCSSTAVQRTLSLRFCPSMAVETAIAQCTSRWAMVRGHLLNTSIVLVAVHGLSGLFWAVSAIKPSLFCPLPPSLTSHLASVDVKQNGPVPHHILKVVFIVNPKESW